MRYKSHPQITSQIVLNTQYNHHINILHLFLYIIFTIITFFFLRTKFHPIIYSTQYYSNFIILVKEYKEMKTNIAIIGICQTIELEILKKYDKTKLQLLNHINHIKLKNILQIICQ